MPKLKFKKIKNSHKIVLLEDRIEQLERRVADLEAARDPVFAAYLYPHFPSGTFCANCGKAINPGEIHVCC